jgi:hypothetical protein
VAILELDLLALRPVLCLFPGVERPAHCRQALPTDPHQEAVGPTFENGCHNPPLLLSQIVTAIMRHIAENKQGRGFQRFT